jgi:hypothetical protein
LDTIIEFIYGPCIENQIFLGKWKKFLKTLNILMSQKVMGNYSGNHQEAKAKLKILYSSSMVLMAIIDIKDVKSAKLIHEIVLEQIDIDNLRQKLVDIFVYKIGGTEDKKIIYQYDMICDHFTDAY